MEELVTLDRINEMMGGPVDISNIDINSPSFSFSGIAFDLYKETAIITAICANLCESTISDEISFPHNQAIAVGLMVRIMKFMSSVMALSCDEVKKHREVILALNRCITESAMNLKFFIEKAEEKDFDDFVNSSLKPERDLYNTIKNNITTRGVELPIEKRMLKSISRAFQDSGINDLSDLDSIPKRKDYKTILKILGLESYYPLLQGVPSHVVHGTWMDILLHHLEKTNSGFKPKTDSRDLDPRLLCPVSFIVLLSVKSYANKYFYKNEITTTFLNRVDDLLERNYKLDHLHEDSLNK